MIDYGKCLEAGCIGGIGAVPGTLAAQGFDVIKIKQQVTGDSLRRAMNEIYNGGGGNGKRGRTARPSVSNFFAGSIPAVKQKIVTRTPMFLVSAWSVQLFETRLGFDPTSAAFVGSAVSGYITGFLASPFEWQKVMVSQRVASPAAGKGFAELIQQAKLKHGLTGGLACLWRRFHAAGIRNAIFDSAFFGTKHMIEGWIDSVREMKHHDDQRREGIGTCNDALYTLASLGSSFAYGVAAICAVSVDYAFDVSVKRSYAIPPESKLPSLGVFCHVIRITRKGGRRIFLGLPVKAVEFAVSYAITGLLSPHVSYFVEDFLKWWE